jgi:hypothetical protein
MHFVVGIFGGQQVWAAGTGGEMGAGWDADVEG